MKKKNVRIIRMSNYRSSLPNTAKKCSRERNLFGENMGHAWSSPFKTKTLWQRRCSAVHSNASICIHYRECRKYDYYVMAKVSSAFSVRRGKARASRGVSHARNLYHTNSRQYATSVEFRNAGRTEMSRGRKWGKRALVPEQPDTFEVKEKERYVNS